MSPLEIRTLGGLTVYRNGMPVTDFDQRKVTALLVYLACTERPQPREMLAELFWEDRPQSQSLANLRVALSNLRKTAGLFVDITRDTAGMSGGGWWLDVTAFEERLASAADDPALLEEALDLYHGDFLEGFTIDSQGFEDWARLERERLRFLAVDALDRLIRTHLTQRDYAAGISHATRLLKLDPLREKTHRHLMHLLALAGEREAALAQYETCRQIMETEFGVQPMEETVSLIERIQAGQLRPETDLPVTRIEPESSPEGIWQRPRHNLHVQSTSFVGREDDIAVISAQLSDPDCHLLTLVGPGGVGKTRLALATAECLVDDFAHGVFFVPLAPLASPDDMVSAIATAVQFRFYKSQDSAEQQLLNFLREKEILLVLDNFEHLLDGAGLVDSLLANAPGVTVLVTTREPLNLSWEWLYEVRGLLHPAGDDVQQPEDYSAIRLFMERARRTQPGFRLDGEREHVIRICQLVEGMPLGIEIAAAWLRIMPPAAIAAELLDLEAPQRDLPDRHHSLRALFDHTWQRLTPPEQDAFMKLSVFRGGFTREAAEAVARTTLPRLATLVNKSLLHCDRASRRYSIHELLRQYAAQQLEVSANDQEGIRTRHAEFFAEYLSDRYVAIRSGNQSELLPEIDNLRSAWDWMIENLNLPAIRKAVRSLFYFYWRQGFPQQGEEAFGHAIAALRNPSTVEQKAIFGELLVMHEMLSTDGIDMTMVEGVALLRETGLKEELAWAQALAGWPPRPGSEAQVRSFYESSLAIFSDLDDRWGIAWCLYGLGRLPLFYSPRFDEGKQYLTEALDIFQEIGDRIGVLDSRFMLATISQVLGHQDDAWQHFKACLDIARVLDNRREIARCLNGMAYLAIDRGQPETAQELAREAVAIANALGDQALVQINLDTLADVHFEQGDFAAARRLYEETLVLAERISGKTAIAFALKQLGFIAQATGDLALARRYYYQALKMFHDDGNLHNVLDCLVGMALLYASEEMGERAMDILGVTIPRPALNKHTRDEARLRAQLEAEFGPEAIAEAIARGKGLDPFDVAREVLAELAQA